MVKNYMEDLVENYLCGIIETYVEVCKCEECLDDVRAMTLNRLKPVYFVESRGSVYSKLNSLESQFEADIVMELIKAIELVSKNPRHSKE